MKVNVVYDNEGNIISVNTLMPASTDANAPRYGVVLGKGQVAAEVDVPAAYAQWGLADIGGRLRVDAASGAPTLVSKNK
jgi:hypothetical protein